MKLAVKQTFMPKARNLPRVRDQIAPAAQYVEEIVAGFEAMLRLICSQRSSWLSTAANEVSRGPNALRLHYKFGRQLVLADAEQISALSAYCAAAHPRYGRRLSLFWTSLDAFSDADQVQVAGHQHGVRVLQRDAKGILAAGASDQAGEQKDDVDGSKDHVLKNADARLGGDQRYERKGEAVGDEGKCREKAGKTPQALGGGVVSSITGPSIA